jgi:hypothetical protein
MNVGDLKVLLADLPDETPVLLQGDEEGNSYHWLRCQGMGFIDRETDYHIDEVYDEDWSPSDCCMDQEEWDNMREEYQKVLVLSP